MMGNQHKASSSADVSRGPSSTRAPDTNNAVRVVLRSVLPKGVEVSIPKRVDTKLVGRA